MEQAQEMQTIQPRKRGWKRIGIEAAIYTSVLLLTFFLFLIFKPMINTHSLGFAAQLFMTLCIVGCLVFISYMGATKRLTTGHVIVILLLIGFVLRVGYMLYTPAAVRQMDTYSYNKRKNLHNGHEGYAWTIFSTGKLPSCNDYQFYHPPLNALLQAGFMKITSAFTRLFSLGGDFFAKFAYKKPSYVDEERYFLYSTCQILAVLYSTVTAVTLVKTLNLFGFSGKLKVLLAAFLILYPRQIQFAGQLNNDGLSYMLGMLALYYALKWWKGERKFIWMIACAFAVGLGMMTKLSSATICLPIAGIFIYEFVCTLRKKEGAMKLWKMVLQYGVFLVICAPIGLWFQVYAKQRFDQNFGYVFDNLVKSLYTGDESFFDRFIFPRDLSEIFGRIYCQTHNGNYHVFNFALRSSIFAEFSYERSDLFAALSIGFAYLAAAMLAAGLVWCGVLYCKQRKNKGLLLSQDLASQTPVISGKDLLFVFLLMQSQAISQIYFNISMPYSCTMDFRYIMPMILAMGLTLGYVSKKLSTVEGKAVAVFHNALLWVVVAFLVSSSAFYLTCA